MYKIIAIGSLVGLIYATNAAQAATVYATNPLYIGNAPGGQITCRVFNASRGSVKLPIRQLFANTGAAVALNTDSCGGTLGPAQGCAYGGASPGNLSFVCKASVTNSDENVTGIIEVFTSNGPVTQALVRQP